jgi:hypothetical protein
LREALNNTINQRLCRVDKHNREIRYYAKLTEHEEG